MEDAGRAVKGDMMKAEDLITMITEYCDWMRYAGILPEEHYVRLTAYLEVLLEILAREEE